MSCAPYSLPFEAENRKERAAAIAQAAIDYELRLTSRSLPPWCQKVPQREASALGTYQLTMVFVRLLIARFRLNWKSPCAQIKNWLFPPKTPPPPFSRFYDLYNPNHTGEDVAFGLPLVAGERDDAAKQPWRTDKEFGWQRCNGLIPEFIEVCRELPPQFRALPAGRVRGLLEGFASLEAAVNAGRIMVSDVCDVLERIPSKEVVTQAGTKRQTQIAVPIALLFATSDRNLVPVAITLERSNPHAAVFTPLDDPALWLAVKTHCNCAQFQVHTLKIHALTEHLMMEPLWAAMCATLSVDHPVRGFLTPYMWNMIFVNNGVRTSLVEDPSGPITGMLVYVLQCDAAGATHIMQRMYDGLTWNQYFDIPRRYDAMGIAKLDEASGTATPVDLGFDYYFRDQTLDLWNCIDRYTAAVVELIYKGSDDWVQQDSELQNFARVLGDPNEGADVRDFPSGRAPDGMLCFDRREQLVKLLTMTIFQCAVRHSHVENAALHYYQWTPMYPGSFTLPIPQTTDFKVDFADIDAGLPSNALSASQTAMIESVRVPHGEVSELTTVPREFLRRGPQFKELNERFNAELSELLTNPATRAHWVEPNNVVKTLFLMPRTLAQSIWN